LRPLYIESRPPASVRLDGRALHIRTTQRAPNVIGLRNVSQIIAASGTRFTSAALNRCMRDGISIVFLDGEGQVQGFLHGRHARSSDLPVRLCELFEYPNGERVYRTWWKAMESRCRCRLAKKLKIPADQYRPRTLHKVMKRERARRAPAWLVKDLENCWQTGLRAVVVHAVENAGINALWQRRLWRHCHIVEDIATLLEWDLFLVMLGQLNKLRIMADRKVPPYTLHAEILRRFESMRRDLSDTAETLLHRLDQRLGDVGLL